MKRPASSGRTATGQLSSVLLVVVVLAFAGYVYITHNDDRSDAAIVTTEPANAESPRPAFIPVANVDVAPMESMHPIGHVVSGDMVGLYGGTQTNACDAAQIEAFLHANPLLANAWAQALRIGTGDIHAYLMSLTALVLRTDTAVTNHGYENGVATPFQSVLQAGTAVFVDAEGLPRVRCRCGNPLQTAAPPRQGVRYVGPTWRGFEPESVTAISPAPKEVKEFVVVDHDKVKLRPRATEGAEDRDVDPPIALTAQRSLFVNRSSTAEGSSDGDRHDTGSSTGTAVSAAGATTSVAATGTVEPTAVAPGLAPTVTATVTATAPMTVESAPVSPTATAPSSANPPNSAVATMPNENPATVGPQTVDPEPHSQPSGSQNAHQGSENQQSGNSESNNQQSNNQQSNNQQSGSQESDGN